MDFIIRKIEQEEIKILDTFLYEAIFIPEDVKKPPINIINQPDLQVYVKEFGTKTGDICFVAEIDGKIIGAVWVRIVNHPQAKDLLGFKRSLLFKFST